MKKILLSVLVLSIFVPAFVSASSVASTTTGTPLVLLKQKTSIKKVTKKKIVKKQTTKVANTSTVAGCTSTAGYSITTGTLCNGTTPSVSNTTATTLVTPIIVTPVKTGYQVCSEEFPNGTWDGTYISGGKYNCVCQTGYISNSAGTACQVDNSEQINAQNYQAQYQAVQAKIQPLKDQLSSLQALDSSDGCPSFQGQSAVQCTLNANEEADISGYETAILNDFLTPVTSSSIAYENKLDDLQQQIFQTKMDYHKTVAGVSSEGISMNSANGQIQNALTIANAKINSLQQQIQTILTDYKYNITP